MQGHILIASPKMDDPNFHRTVIVMVEHSDEGAMGLVINRPLETTIDEAWRQVSSIHCEHDGPVFQGGPCPGPLMILHADDDRPGREIQTGLFFAHEAEEVENIIQNHVTPARFVVGYAGWGPGQLDDEFEWGVWLACDASVNQLFGDTSRLWMRLLEQIDPTAAALAAKPGLNPSDPSMN